MVFIHIVFAESLWALFLLAVRCWFVFICWTNLAETKKTFEVLRLPRWQAIGLIGSHEIFVSACWNQEASRSNVELKKLWLKWIVMTQRAPKNITIHTGTQIGIANPFLATVPIKFGEHSCLFRSAKTSFCSPFWVFVRCSCLLCWWPPLACSCLEKNFGDRPRCSPIDSDRLSLSPLAWGFRGICWKKQHMFFFLGGGDVLYPIFSLYFIKRLNILPSQKWTARFKKRNHQINHSKLNQDSTTVKKDESIFIP